MLRLLMTILCLGFGWRHQNDALASPLPRGPALSGTITTQIAFADFDGDRQPDMAVLEGEHFSALKTHYSLTLSFSTGNRQSIALTGPSGGLFLLPRDVNGDNTLDLVVTARWLHEPVAVFLNDGLGGFSSADPAKFSIDLHPSEAELKPARLLQEHGAVLPGTQPSYGEPAENSSVSLPRLRSGLLICTISVDSSHQTGSAFSGRAPPSSSSAS
jgi:hypothetical protein